MGENKYVQTLTPINAHTRTPYPYDHLRETESKKLYPTGIKIDKVTVVASLSTRTSSLYMGYSKITLISMI
jgi:hypothetical protein